MNALTVNKETGFLESVNPSLNGFTSLKKLRFLEIVNELAERGEYPSIHKLCDNVGVNAVCFYDHLRKDPQFKQQWELALRRIENVLVQTMVANGQKPSGYMDRITWLRRHFPEWNPDQRVQISNDNSQVKNVIIGLNDAIDAEIVPNSPNIITPASNIKSDSDSTVKE